MRTLLVTGATSGIGHATAQLALESGHTVIGVGRGEAPAELAHDRYTHVRLDVSRPTIGTELIDAIPATLAESVDALVNAAAVDVGGKNDFAEMSPEHIAQTIQTNLLGLALVTRAVLPGLLARPLADIVNITSQSVLEPSPQLSNYAATKFGVHGLTIALRKELAKSSVRVTEVKPGIVRTSFSANRWLGDTARGSAYYDSVGPILSARDVAETILYCIGQSAGRHISDVSIVPR